MSMTRDRIATALSMCTSDTSKPLLETVVELVEKEKALHRREIAHKVMGLPPYATPQVVENTILNAGTDQLTGPFGCDCDWKQSQGIGFPNWWLSHKAHDHWSHQCDYCPRCGKPKCSD